MCTKISQWLGLLQRIKFCIPNVTLRMLYNILVLRLFDYGNIIYRTIDQYYLKQLHILQNKGACMLLNCHYMTHIRDMLTELNWMTVKEWADHHSTCLIYKCQNNLAPQYLVDNFNNISESHNYNTRSSTHADIRLAKPNNNQLMRTFKYNRDKLWHALAISVRGKPSLNSFKGAYIKDLFTHR